MPESFDERRQRLTIERNLCTINGEECWCDIISPEMEPKIPNFVGLIDLEKNEFFISVDVPRKFRRPMIAHELHCLSHMRQGHAGHCISAVEVELGYVMPSDRTEYLTLRRKLFDDLIVFHEARGNSKLVAELAASRDFLYAIN